MNDTLIATTEEGLLHILLNRPQQLNALNHELLQELSYLLDNAKKNPTIKSVLITGEGKGFCAGADIKELQTLDAITGIEFARYGQHVFNQLESLSKPSLAAIHGFALGGGCELAMAATLRIAANNTIFSQPEIKLGIIPGFGGTQRLSRLIGKGRSMEMCLTGKRIQSEEALAWGLINEVTTSEQLIKTGKKILSQFRHLSPSALASIMNVIHEGYDLPIDSAFNLEAVQFGICCATKDKSEGVNAFLEKRQPIFKGD